MTSLDEANKVFNHPGFFPVEEYVRSGEGRYLPCLVEGNRLRIFESEAAKNTYVLKKRYGYPT